MKRVDDDHEEEEEEEEEEKRRSSCSSIQSLNTYRKDSCISRTFSLKF